MRFECISPFVISAHEVLKDFLHSNFKKCSITQKDSISVSGISITTFIYGGIEGRIVLDIEPSLAKKIAGFVNCTQFDYIDYLAIDTICEITNIIIGNAITSLNNKGFILQPSTSYFFIGEKTYHDLESLCIIFTTKWGDIKIHASIEERMNFFEDKELIYA